MHIIEYVILGCWVAFWVYWLAASVGVKPGQRRLGRFAGIRVGILLLVLLLVRTGGLHGQMATHNAWQGGIGLAIFLLGLALAIWARVYLGRNWGMPMSEKKEDPELVTTGPYRRVRHPIYSGILLGLIGTAIAVGVYWFIGVALIGAYFAYSAIMEERLLASEFPDSYPEYQRTSKRLVPFVF